MKLIDVISEDNILVDLKATTKEEVIAEMVDQLVATGYIEESDKEAAVEEIMSREKLGSTGIGNGLAIPHNKKSQVVKEVVGAFAKSEEGIEFSSIDGEPSHIFFLFFAPESLDDEGAQPHLKILKKLALLGRDQNFCRFLKETESNEEAHDLIEEIDEKMTAQMA